MLINWTFKDPLFVSIFANRVLIIDKSYLDSQNPAYLGESFILTGKTCESTLRTQGFRTHVVASTRIVLLWMVLSAGGHNLLISLSTSPIPLVEDCH